MLINCQHWRTIKKDNRISNLVLGGPSRRRGDYGLPFFDCEDTMENQTFRARIDVRVTADLKEKVRETAQRVDRTEPELVRLLLNAGLETLENVRLEVSTDGHKK